MKKLFAISALALAGVAFASDSTADVKAFHGAYCDTIRPWDLNVHLSFNYYGVKKLGAGAALVACPLMRDRISSGSGINLIAVEILNEPDGGNYVDCTLWTQREDTSSLSYYDYDFDYSTTTGKVQLELSAATYNGNEGSYYLECMLSEDDILAHIHLDEANSSD